MFNRFNSYTVIIFCHLGQQVSLGWAGTLTYLMATPKRLRVAEFTVWTEITSFNFLLLHKGAKEIKATHQQGLSFRFSYCISNCSPAKVIFDEYF